MKVRAARLRLRWIKKLTSGSKSVHCSIRLDLCVVGSGDMSLVSVLISGTRTSLLMN
jgi:hypothetical protein